jgi:hypothetical protein
MIDQFQQGSLFGVAYIARDPFCMDAQACQNLPQAPSAAINPLHKQEGCHHGNSGHSAADKASAIALREARCDA